ncbi:MAG: hypothetical protein NW200_10745 [Hyphomonadaceae bacterium]|nr:hypothetical protein [Hyphomonadaceae bacterium]
MADSPVPVLKAPTVAPPNAPGRGGRVHWAHVAMVALHTLCCGLPLAASAIGLAASAALVGDVLRLHAFLHGRELWLLGVSAVLVALGGVAEWRLLGGGRRRVSLLFAISLACFAFNAAIVAGHRLAEPAGGEVPRSAPPR